MKRVVFEFPDEVTAKAFLGWFCDGGGEEIFFESEEHRAERDKRKAVRRFDYERAYPAWGYKPEVHGPDFTVKAET